MRLHDAVATELGQSVVDARPLAGGHSHRTWLVTLTDERVVIRCGAADPAVEAAVMARAAERVPVPEVRCVLPEFGAMAVAWLPGSMVEEILAGPLSDAEAEELGAAVGRVVTRIGTVGFERPGFFIDATLAVAAGPPWSRQLPDFVAERMPRVPSSRLDARSRDRWIALCARHAPSLTAVDDEARLVHADLNPKNLLAERGSDGWRVTGVLDWEFAFSGCRCADSANMLRFAADRPAGFTAGFRRAWTSVDEYRGSVMDMFALTDLVTRPVGHPIADRAALVIADWLATGVPGLDTGGR